jgi:hypothetical protein
MAHAEATKGRNIRGLAVYTRGTQAHPGPHCYVHKWFNSNVLYDPHQAAPIPAPDPPRTNTVYTRLRQSAPRKSANAGGGMQNGGKPRQV